MHKIKKQQGFTLVELMIYTALTAIIVGLFGGILVTVTRIQGQQGGSVEVSREMNFMINAITSRIRDAKSITSVNATRIDFVTNTYPSDTTTINLIGEKIYVAENGQASAPLSSDRIRVDDLSFTELSDDIRPSSTAILISVTATSNSANPQKTVTRTVQTSASPLLMSQ